MFELVFTRFVILELVFTRFDTEELLFAIFVIEAKPDTKLDIVELVEFILDIVEFELAMLVIELSPHIKLPTVAFTTACKLFEWRFPIVPVFERTEPLLIVVENNVELDIFVVFKFATEDCPVKTKFELESVNTSPELFTLDNIVPAVFLKFTFVEAPNIFTSFDTFNNGFK